jgi:thioredoxin 1
MSSSQSVTDTNFETEVLKAAGPVLVDFYADWCGPCKAMTPLIDELATLHKDKLKVVKINIDDSPNAPTKYGVRGIPTFMVFKDGKVADTRVGGMSKSQLSSWVDSVLV